MLVRVVCAEDLIDLAFTHVITLWFKDRGKSTALHIYRYLHGSQFGA